MIMFCVIATVALICLAILIVRGIILVGLCLLCIMMLGGVINGIMRFDLVEVVMCSIGISHIINCIDVP